jgi:molecular chaperone GrpE
MDPKTPNDADDDSYVLEDDGSSVEEIEHEMARAAAEATGETPAAAAQVEDAQTREWRDRYMRTLADFDNYRKRADREKQEFFKHALATTFRELLPVLDNFDRALEHAEEGDEFHRGVALIYKQLWDVLQKQGLRAIGEANVHFDPKIHEAVVSEENPSVPSQTVVELLQKGYFLNDRLLRPALVKVAVGGPEERT